MVSDVKFCGLVACWKIVLILLLMEYGLGPLLMRTIVLPTVCLNPSFNGIWSRTDIENLGGIVINLS